MEIKLFTDPAEALKFAENLAAEDNTIGIDQTSDMAISIRWIKNKKYTAPDLKEYTDEVWAKEDGTLIACQDLEPDHARNIIRLFLRNSRRAEQRLNSTLTEINNGDDDTAPNILH